MTMPLFTGQWSNDITWEFFVSDDMPPEALCTAASCVGVSVPSARIVLTRTRRGWECMGGHIEDGETVTEAMRREALEEGGFRVESFQLIGYRKITSRRQIVAPQTGKAYPLPHSYVPWFLTTTSLPLIAPTGDEGEVHEARAFTLSAVRALRLADQPIIETALNKYLKRR